ncbi:amidohydrolase family protein [Lacibacter sp.]|uniref:amidohydrolase family protein n=1 Tax=Lacibacter sp. TaxID=1915409 RepID=UPI002B4B7FBE|nr:amidohydrolase family protein [Lacibacter sp.]HLP38253.1 amidohydrolase family protein [Lacibacter sp.]
MRLADTHVHIWDFNRAEYAWLEGNTSILNRTYSIEELETERFEIGIKKGILVQAANNFEDTDWMLHMAVNTDWIAGIVGWLPLINPDATLKALQKKYGKENYFKGVRHLIHDERDPEWLLQPEVINSLQILADHNIPYDVVGVLPEHIETALQVASKVPELRMVFDHLNQPPIATKEKFGRWGELMKEAAQHKNFYAKISGLGLTAQKNDQWTADDIKPYVGFAIEQFGTDRCFMGGDWPVSLLAGSYSNTWKNFKEVIHDLVDDKAADKIFYSNAANFYSF